MNITKLAMYKKLFGSGSGGGSISAPLIVHSLVNDDGTFANTNFKRITIMTESVGARVFKSCTGLESVELDGVISVGAGAFDGCTSLTSITIPNSVTSIGGTAFNACTLLKSVYISDIGAWCDIEFANNSANPCFYGAVLYLNGEKLTELVIPDTVTAIKNNAFRGYSSLTSVTIPDSVTSIGNYAFRDCVSLTSVTLKGAPTSINSTAFEGCTVLTTINVPWAEGEVANAPWGATNATINYNYTEK